jgi:hypothetical protein
MIDKEVYKEKLVAAALELTKQPMTACGYQQLTVTGASAQALTVPSGTTYCEIRVESATTSGVIMRYTLLGATTEPTTAAGMPLVYLDLFDINGGDNVVNFRVIAVSGSHTLNIQYYKHI